MSQKINFSYVSSNCMGGLMYQHFKEQYNDPFIWSLILDDFEFVRLCKDFDDYILKKPELTTINKNCIWCKDTNKSSFNDWQYPVTDLSGIQIHWIHHTNQEEKLLNSFTRRVDRYNTIKDKSVVFLFNSFTLFQNHTEKTLKELLEVFLKNKHSSIAILPDDLSDDIYNMFDNKQNICIKMNGMKFKNANRNQWNYNLQDTPDKREKFIEVLSNMKCLNR
jgi:uncharacterized protein (DUF1919 family)